MTSRAVILNYDDVDDEGIMDRIEYGHVYVARAGVALIIRNGTEMKRGVLEPELGVVIRILELLNTFLGAYQILPNSTRFDLQCHVSGTTKRGIPQCHIPHPAISSRAILSEVLLPRGTILLNSTCLCAQAMRHARGLHKPHAASEHDLHTKRFVTACSVRWY